MQQRGMAKLLRLRMTLLTISLALAASWWCGVTARQAAVAVSLPQTSAAPGSSIVIPITVTDLSGRGIVAQRQH
jgi:predicted S18 family serine protease